MDTITIDSDVLTTIRGVEVESTGRAPSGTIEECRAFCEQWLHEQTAIEVSAATLAESADANPEWTTLHCQQVAAVDAAMSAYYAAHKHAPDNLSAAPIF